MKVLMMRLLRTKLRVYFVMGLGAFLCVFFALLFFIRPPKQERAISLSTTAVTGLERRGAESEKDSDADGLKDWEEPLFRTDKNNPDTDGDGTNDGKEIAQERDPAKKGPNDTLIASVLAAAPNTEDSLINEINYTKLLAEKFGQEFLIPSAQNQGQNPPNPELLAGRMAQEILAQSSANTPRIFYRDKDVRTSSDNTAATWQKHLQQVDAVVIKEFGALLAKPEIEVFAAALKTGDTGDETLTAADTEKLADLDPYLVAFDRAIADLKKIQAPSELSWFHLDYLNLAARQQSSVQKMRDADQDMVSALVGMQEYAAAIKEFDDLLARMRAEFGKRKIALSNP